MTKSSSMRIGVCSDHAGFEYKDRIISYLLGKGYEVVNYGTNSTESCDYPDYAHALGNAVDSGEVDCGIALCGTGNGMAMTLNKHKKVRAALSWGVALAVLAKEHNNANVLVLPARFISYRMALACIRAWLSTGFEAGRHLRRIEKI